VGVQLGLIDGCRGGGMVEPFSRCDEKILTVGNLGGGYKARICGGGKYVDKGISII